MNVLFDHLEKNTSNVITFYFKPNQTIKYLAGQYVELSLPGEKNATVDGNRWYTLSSSPSEDLVAITTRFDKTLSKFKQSLINLKTGDQVIISEPIGDFVLPKDITIPLMFISGGIGITPVRSIIKWLIDQRESRPITLIYFARHPSDLVYNDLFSAYEMTYKPVITSESKIDILKVLLPLKVANPNALYYVSGPQIMVEKIAGIVAGKFGNSQVIMDYFPGYSTI